MNKFVTIESDGGDFTFTISKIVRITRVGEVVSVLMNVGGAVNLSYSTEESAKADYDAILSVLVKS